MDYNDLAFAQACVRALRIVAEAGKEWVRQKTLEKAPKTDQQQQPNTRNDGSAR